MSRVGSVGLPREARRHRAPALDATHVALGLRSGMTSIDRPAVLIVDDNPDKLLALESVLLDVNVTIVKATSGEEALRRLLTEDFAVILLDVRMPSMDGIETAALVRQRPRT